MSKPIQIEDYKPVDASTHCKFCKSDSVTWHEVKNEDGTTKWVLSEIFTLAGEEVYSISDIHMRYCETPKIPWRVKEEDASPTLRRAKRQDAIWKAADDFIDEPSEPMKIPDGEIQTDGHPYCCSTCGRFIVDGLDGTMYDWSRELGIQVGAHTCGNADEIGAGQANGTRAGRKVKFAEISSRMDKLQADMEFHKDQMNPETPETQGWGAEYLILRKRLHTEIPK